MSDTHWPRRVPLVLTLLALGLAAGALVAAAGTTGPAQSDTLVDLQAYSPQTMDPHWLYDTASARIATQVYERLVQRSGAAAGELVPALATGWQTSPADDTFTFTIRSGVHFHAGGTLEPHDVAYSFWRAMIQDRAGGPMWMWFEPFFGVYSIEDLPGDDLAKCQAVKGAITYDDAAGTVTFHLAESRGDAIALLESSPGSILDQEWMAANGGWAGDCADWRAYHDPAVGDSILYDQANGTGPFRLDSWSGGEVHLLRYDGYWRRDPAWDGGPAGPAALDGVVIIVEPSWAVRRDALLAGTADLVAVPTTATVELDPDAWGVYHGYEDATPTLVHPTGTLRLYRDQPGSNLTPLQLNHTIVPTDNAFIGSGTLDGDGIPPDFFGDLDVRQGFNYAFDWADLIATAYGGDARHVPGPIPEGVVGYSDAQPGYPYSLTLAAQAFQQAWGGQVWTQGFSLTVAYNEGSDTRQAFCEILKQGIEAVNADFHVQVVSMPWPDLLNYRRDRMLPVYAGGWFEDYHHPYNWVQPFLDSAGVYAHAQNFSPALAAILDDKIEACRPLVDPSAVRTCYEELQALAHQHAVGVYAVQPVGRTYLRTEVRGYYFRPGLPYPDYYALSKGLRPGQAPVAPGSATTLAFPHASGSATTTIDLPAGAVGEPVVLVHTPDIAVGARYVDGLRVGGFAFELDACVAGECQPGYALAEPATLTLKYDDADVAGLVEEALYLYTWDGSAWVDVVDSCGWPASAYGRYPDENRLVVPICHLSPFVTAGEYHAVYLPLVAR